MEKIYLWPTPVYHFKTENINNDKVKEILLEKEKTEPTRELSNRGGWQSHAEILKDDGFSEIEDFLPCNFISFPNPTLSVTCHALIRLSLPNDLSSAVEDNIKAGVSAFVKIISLVLNKA